MDSDSEHDDTNQGKCCPTVFASTTVFLGHTGDIVSSLLIIIVYEAYWSPEVRDPT